MMKRRLLNQEHSIFHQAVRRFIEREIVPYDAQWEEDSVAPHELWLKAGLEGLLCRVAPGEIGGLGFDYLFAVGVFAALCRAGASGAGFLI